MSPRQRAAAGILLIIVLLAGSGLRALAYDEVNLKLATVTGSDWSARAVNLQFAWLDGTHIRLQLRAESARFPEPVGELSALVLECSRASLTPGRIRCPQGWLNGETAHLGAQRIGTSFEYDFEAGRLEVDLQGIRLHGGQVALQGYYSGSGWQLRASGDGLRLDGISDQLAAAGLLSAPLAGSGTIGFTAQLRGRGERFNKAMLQARLNAREFTNDAGTLAGEGLEFQLDVEAVPLSDGWRLAVELVGEKGQLYIEPVFLEIPGAPLRASAELYWTPGNKRLAMHAFEYRHPDTVDVQATGAFVYGAASLIESLRLDIRQAAFPSLYTYYLQPWLTETMLANLETAGALQGQISWRDGQLLTADLGLVDIGFHDKQERFGLEQVQGRIDWSSEGEARKSELQWESGHIYQIPLGAVHLAAETSGARVRLTEPVEVPLLDGSLEIDQFNLDYDESSRTSWNIDAILTPVSMRQLSQSLGWPEFAGKLSGVIPDVRYAAGELKVGGMLLVRVFDGEVTLKNIRLEQPFGLVPRLWLDAGATNIDLEPLTRAFSFGRIEGRMEGRVEGLYMESWRPVAFDAAFATPEHDRSRHRISQKAVDNISSVGGGGVGGALSRSFLRFFEEFPYDRLGISCRLENGVCEMDGVGPAANGYYLVKGSLLPPRLDVIGYANRVNWNSLVAQLVGVTERQAVQVQ